MLSPKIGSCLESPAGPGGETILTQVQRLQLDQGLQKIRIQGNLEVIETSVTDGAVHGQGAGQVEISQVWKMNRDFPCVVVDVFKISKIFNNLHIS